MEKILVDTNIILRFIIDSDPKLKSLIHNYIVIAPLPVVFETIFVLESFYKVDRETISTTLTNLFANPNIQTEKDLLQEIFTLYKNNTSLGLVDCYLLALSKKDKLPVETCDKKLLKLSSLK